MNSLYVFVLERADDGHIATERHEKYSVSGRHQRTPERPLRQPESADELVIDAVSCHASRLGFDDHRKNSEERRQGVRDALVHDQNAHRLYTNTARPRVSMAVSYEVQGSKFRIDRKKIKPRKLATATDRASAFASQTTSLANADKRQTRATRLEASQGLKVTKW